MNENYNKREYLALLKKQSINGKLNSEDFDRILDYGIIATNYFNWCIREHYLDLLENFQKGKMETFDFCRCFDNTNKIVDNFTDVLESNLIVLSPNDKSLVFADLLEEIFDECEAYLQTADFDSRLYMSKDYNIEVKKHEKQLKEIEVELKKSVRETYLKIQNFLKEG